MVQRVKNLGVYVVVMMAWYVWNMGEIFLFLWNLNLLVNCSMELAGIACFAGMALELTIAFFRCMYLLADTQQDSSKIIRVHIPKVAHLLLSVGMHFFVYNSSKAECASSGFSHTNSFTHGFHIIVCLGWTITDIFILSGPETSDRLRQLLPSFFGRFERPYIPIEPMPESLRIAIDDEDIDRSNSNRCVSTECIKRFKDTNIIAEHSQACTICLIDFAPEDQVAQLKCSHVYHQECMNQWIKENASCPLCRDNLPLQYSH